MKFIRIEICFLALVLMFASCKKEKFEFIPYGEVSLYPGNAISIKNMFQDFQDNNEWQTFTSDAASHLYWQSAENVIVDLPQNSLVNSNGDVITGEIEWTFILITEKGDMVKYGRHTMQSAGVLDSDGEIFVEARLNGEVLSLAPGARISFKIPNENPSSEMLVWYGQEENDQFVWVEADEIENTPWGNPWITEWDSQTGDFDFGYELLSEKLGWINCDAYLNSDYELTDVEVTIPEEFTNINAAVFIVLEDLDAVGGLWGSSETENFSISGMPIGEAVTIVVLGILESDEGDKTYYYATQSGTLTVNYSVTIETMIESTLDDIEGILENI